MDIESDCLEWTLVPRWLRVGIMFIKVARKESVTGLLAALLCSGLAVAAERPAPIATLDLSGQWPGAVATSLAFASEDTIAITRYPGSDTVSLQA